MTQNDFKKERAPRVSRGVAFAAAALALMALAIVLYGIKAPGGKEAAETPACPGAAELVARLKPPVHGEIAALILAPRRKPLPELAFDTPEGTKASLADFKGARSCSTFGRHGAFPAAKKCPLSIGCKASSAKPLPWWR